MAFFGSTPQLTPVTPKAKRESQKGRRTRILVIGSEGHGRGVTSYAWEKLPAGLNVADYEVAILNFSAFEEDPDLAAGFDLDRLPRTESLTRLIFSPQSEVIAIGNPWTQIGPAPESVSVYQAFGDRRKRADYWLPFFFALEEGNGTSFETLSGDWDFYFAQLSGYRWFMTGELPWKGQDLRYLEPVTKAANRLEAYMKPLAQTRFEKAVGAEVVLRALEMYRHNPPGSPVATSGGIATAEELVAESSGVFWLPAPDRVDSREAIDLILRERFGIAEPVSLPTWMERHALPRQRDAEAEVAELEARLRNLGDELAEAESRVAAAAAPRALLYEKDEVLERAVLAALRELGADVTDPESSGIEDGILVRPEGSAVIEVKGRRNQIKQDDVRQVVQWASDARLRDEVEYKAIIVGNPFCQTPLEDRGDPLAPNGARYAKTGDVALLTTAQVFEALRRKQAGEFDEEGFWSAVFSAAGLVEAPATESQVSETLS